jgi:hypothetical protein
MIKAKLATNLQPAYFEWDEKFRVLIRNVSPAVRMKLIKSSEEIVFNKKHQKSSEPDWLKYGKTFMREAIAGWEGMTYRYLLDICQPIELEPGVKLDDPIEFNEENVSFVVENYRLEFGNFVIHSVEALDDIYAGQKKKELENL